VKKLLAVAVGIAMLAFPAVALADPSTNPDFNFSRTFEFDPDHTGCPEAQWENGAGRADSTGNTTFGLVLEKNCAITVNASAGAVGNSVRGTIVNAGPSLGWDQSPSSPCGAGAPRFNILQEDGSFHFAGGCANATKTTTPDGWTRVRIDPYNPAQAFPPLNPASGIQDISIIVDEPGQYVVDNIMINGRCAEKPGMSRTCQP
jgi:hypothetical protein